MSSQIKGDQPKLLQVWIGRLAVPIDAAAKQTVNEYNWLTLGISGFFDGDCNAIGGCDGILLFGSPSGRCPRKQDHRSKHSRCGSDETS